MSRQSNHELPDAAEDVCLECGYSPCADWCREEQARDAKYVAWCEEMGRREGHDTAPPVWDDQDVPF
jgi:hypothetical protein